MGAAQVQSASYCVQRVRKGKKGGAGNLEGGWGVRGGSHTHARADVVGMAVVHRALELEPRESGDPHFP